MNKQKKYRLPDIITSAGLLLIIYGFAAALLITPDKDFSEDENRALQTLPNFSLEALTSGEYTKQIAAYCTDQMPLRNLFVGAKSASEMLIGKQENNGVILGSDGHIIAKSDRVNLSIMDKNLAAIKKFAAGTDVPFHVAIAGRSQDVLIDCIPSLYPAREVSDTAFSHLTAALGDTAQIDLLSPLRSRASDGEYVYYRTDHHWTTLGAYYAYVEIMASLGIEPHPIEYFTRETVSEEFYGTTWSKAGMRRTAPDSMEFFRFDGDDSFVTEIVDNGTLLDGMYDRSYLEKKDKYSAFIGGNNGRVSIYPKEDSPFASGEREVLVLIKDSFGHSLAPFLAAHFDLEILDLRYYKLPVSDVLAESSADRVLIMYNMDSLVSSSNLAMLTIGMK
ncbi:MAG: hypothetical protein IJF48_03965 [Clostridia bacterium]|nr:hypothetical protein [Clostridia bacterium]